MFVLVTLFLPRGIAGLIPAVRTQEKKAPGRETEPDPAAVSAEPLTGSE
jgi:hypothetical protein